MAVPSYFATTFVYKTYAAGTILDITNVIAAIRDALTVQLTGANAWVESPSGTFTSPTDGGGRFMQLVVVRSTATLMTIKLIDRVGRNDTEGFVITGAGQSLEISCSSAHLYMWLSDASAGVLTAMVDPSPEALNSQTTDTFIKSIHNSSGSAVSFGTLPDRGIGFGDIVGNTTYYTRFMGPYFGNNSTACQLLTAGGSLLFLPVVAATWPAELGMQVRMSGHFPHLVWIDANLAGGVLSVPIDNGVVGQFKWMPPWVTQGSGFETQCGRLAARVG